MIYNPIFEEEIERKVELNQLKKEIKSRARKETIQSAINRVYGLLQKKPALTLAAIFQLKK